MKPYIQLPLKALRSRKSGSSGPLIVLLGASRKCKCLIYRIIGENRNEIAYAINGKNHRISYSRLRGSHSRIWLASFSITRGKRGKRGKRKEHQR